MTQQTIFPYIIISDRDDHTSVARNFAENDVETGKGMITFLSEADFSVIYDALKNAGPGFALIKADNVNYFGDGTLDRVVSNIRRA